MRRWRSRHTDNWTDIPRTRPRHSKWPIALMIMHQGSMIADFSGEQSLCGLLPSEFSLTRNHSTRNSASSPKPRVRQLVIPEIRWLRRAAAVLVPCLSTTSPGFPKRRAAAFREFYQSSIFKLKWESVTETLRHYSNATF